ncbi:MAG: M13 family metallopeptidase [Paraprevotella sp.]|nr:M13 family metallopeptidase [Paraprevotella sp.]
MKLKFFWSFVVGAVLSAATDAQPTLKDGIDLSDLDQSVKPGESFYEYANGGWNKKHPLPPENPRYGTFEELIEKNTEQLQGIIETYAQGHYAEGSLEQKVGELYNIVMDSVKQNREGYDPIKSDLETIAAIKYRKEVIPMMASLMRKGVQGYFSFDIDADIKNSSMNLVGIGQDGLSLGEREYYLDQDSATVHVREAFKVYVKKMFVLCGFSEADARKKMKAVLDIETRIARPSYSAAQRRVPEANYHKMTYADLQKNYAGIDWDSFFKAMGVKGLTEVCLSQIEPIREVEKILAEVPVEEQKSYMEWKLIDAAAPYLSDELRECSFDFYSRTMSGQQQQRPRWKRAVASVESAMGEGLGRLYVEKYFPAAAKARMLKLVKNLQSALAARIQAQDWMSDETKKVALDKLNAFYVKIGYPNKWRDYSGLVIKNDSYWANVVRCCEFDMAYMIAHKLNKPVDREDWFMTPQTVNAYYNPTTNEICFPAGILQPPFFDMSADDAYNYGAIGVVIGHEMTHGFDDQGRQFDKNGNLCDWWAPGDAERFEARAKVMKDFFDQISVLPDLKANGALTLGENLADHGGLMVAYHAFQYAMKEKPLKTEDCFTPEQRFFLAYAHLWAGNISDERIRFCTKSDPHALGRWRVDGELPHIDMWYDAFGITEKDPMFIPKEKRVTIW